MITPERLGAVVKAFNMPKQPEILWYIAPKHARLELGEQIQLLLETSKVLATMEWIDYGVLLIVWATSSLNDVSEILTNIAIICGIPITVLAY